tara:strand:- start:5422 stop:5607 length:186 start_codon:yes stop_codon:yes gene_type:complete
MSKTFKEIAEESESRMNIIGQNGNDGLHYDYIVDDVQWTQTRTDDPKIDKSQLENPPTQDK